MKIVSWNVNSLRVRQEHVENWLQQNQPDVLAIQETKMTDDVFPHEAFSELGYHSLYSGQKTYNGVAILSKLPGEDVITDIPLLDDPQRRIMAATFDGVRVLNLYVVNGSEVGTDKYAYKLDWLDKVYQYVVDDSKKYQDYVILGDFNIAPEDADVHDANEWKDKILCSEPEREALNKLLDLGFSDTFRLFDQDEDVFSWWDYRAAGFRRNRGLRIDLVLASDALVETCQASYIDYEPRKLDRPSDHAPAVAEFEI